jgi:peptidoglycan/xylan/chitin deacetylase (PgdA/CDA1 family)
MKKRSLKKWVKTAAGVLGLALLVSLCEIPGSTVDVSGDQQGEAILVTEAAEKLDMPEGFTVKAQKNGIRLTWEEVEDAKKYEVYRKQPGDESYELIRTTVKLAYTDKEVSYGETYVYKLRAIAENNGKTIKSICTEKQRCTTYFVDPNKKMVALTFDDGPSQYTDGILDTLEKYNARATFFEVGNRVSLYPAAVSRIDKLGCELGNHSYDHARLGSASVSKLKSESKQTDKKIKAITGKTPTLFRPPYGSIGTNMKKTVKKPFILWSIDTEDWKSRNADSVYNRVIGHVSDGDIILMHDLYSSTEAAAKRIIPKLVEQGYQLVTVSELAQYRDVTLVDGESYSKLK